MSVVLPFALRPPLLLARDLLVDRDDPDLAALGGIADPERFVWAILPHAARTFSACIALLPARAARAAAVAYLYCRILDTYEDLSENAEQAAAALGAFAQRFGQQAGDGSLPHPPPLGEARAKDARDRAHLLLVARCEQVDAVYARLEPGARALIREVVADMAAGMAATARRLERQGGVLADHEQLLTYCRAVLGNPVLFATRLSRLHHTGDATLTPQQREACLVSGEFIQLANVTRDIEKDLARGVAWHPALKGDLGRVVPRPGTAVPGRLPDAEAAGARGSRPDAGRQAPGGDLTGAPADPALIERVRAVREDLLRLALGRAGAYPSLVAALDLSRLGLTRASALLMLLFTDRYYRGCAARCGMEPWGPRASGPGLLARTLPAVLSHRWTHRLVSRTVARMEAASRAPGPRGPAAPSAGSGPLPAGAPSDAAGATPGALSAVAARRPSATTGTAPPDGSHSP